jgi:RNA polymerase sigma factor (sigma-70 family)
MNENRDRAQILTAYARNLIRLKARQLCRKPTFSLTDDEDISQELIAKLLAKDHLYDEDRGSRNTFAERVIRAAITELLRNRGRKKRAPGYELESIDQAIGSGPECEETLRDLLTEDDLLRRTGGEAGKDVEKLTTTVAEAIEQLPSELQQICALLMQGSKAAAARSLEMSKSELAKQIAVIRRNFEDKDLVDL